MNGQTAEPRLRRPNLYVALMLSILIFAVGFLTLFEGGYVEMGIAVVLFAAVVIVLAHG